MNPENASGSLKQSPTLNRLAAKLARILGEVGKVPKSGHNAFHKYDYVTENDLVYAVRDKLAEAQIFVFTSTVAQRVEIIKEEDKTWALTTVETEHTFTDGESGEWFTVRSQGQGADNGDKGGYKAITGAMKYFLYKCFMIPTGDDPEGDDKTDQRGATQTARKPATTTTKPAVEEKKTPEVPREVNTKLRDSFAGGAWAKVKIHFGKNKGRSLGEMENEDPRSIQWYADDWFPKPYNGKISPDDEALRAALDAYLFEK